MQTAKPQTKFYPVIHPKIEKQIGNAQNGKEALLVFEDYDLYGIVCLEPYKNIGMCYLLEQIIDA